MRDNRYIRPHVTLNLTALEERLKQLGIAIVCSKQDTVVSIKIQGLAGKALVDGLHYADQYLQEKIKLVLQNNLACDDDTSTKRFVDPVFGPTRDDEWGASAMCKNGQDIPSKGGTPHQMKVLQLLKSDKIRWERPVYAVDEDLNGLDNQRSQDDNQDREEQTSSDNEVFASEARLFADGVSSGDVVQGNLGNCWFLSALSVVATRRDLLEQTFWRGDDFRSKGLFVCRFMKNFVWNYVVIDDRIPVFGFGHSKPGKPFFARCRDPNELWVVILEKAYAKLHGSYEALIGGFVDVALNDLTGMCSEQVIMKKGHPGFGEDPFAPRRPGDKRGDPFWDKIMRYKSTGTLMGCSIQPPPTGSDKNVAAEQSAGNGLYYKHAYALVDAGEINTAKNGTVKLVKLRNPWGMGEWTGPWSDATEERIQNQDIIEQFFRMLKRNVGSNAQKRVYLDINHRGELTMNAISQEEVVDINTNDGTFFMSYDAWMQYYTHFFAGIDFPDEWTGRRVEGCWNELNCGGNITTTTWLNNPHFEFVVEERSRIFISLSQEDPRGKENLKIVPIGFHICSLCACADNPKKFEIREPSGKANAYYRLYKDRDRSDYKSGARPEMLPPAIIPGSVIPKIHEDGVPQPAYTFKQSVSAEVTIEPGRYCIIPSMYMRTDKASGKTNVGSFWISIYSNTSSFKLEGGEKIAEEEEGDETDAPNASPTEKKHHGGRAIAAAKSPSSPPRRVSWMDSSLNKCSETSLALHNEPPPPIEEEDRRRNSIFDKMSSTETENVKEKRRRFETAKEEFLALAKAKGIGLREIKKEFQHSNATTNVLKKHEFRRKLVALGFKIDELAEEKVVLLFSGLDQRNSGVIANDQIIDLFEKQIEEDRIVADSPEIEDDLVPEKLHQEGWLELEIRSAKDLCVDIDNDPTTKQQQRTIRLPALEFSQSEQRLRKRIVWDIVDHAQAFKLTEQELPFLEHTGWTHAKRKRNKKRLASHSRENESTKAVSSRQPVQLLYKVLDEQFQKSARYSKGRNQAEGGASSDEVAQDAKVPITSVTTEKSAPTGSPMKSTIRTRSILRTSVVAFSPASLPLHKTGRMRDLENRRFERFKRIQKSKQDSLGDKQKMMGLPRLIGGRKSGSTMVACFDCGVRFEVPKRSLLAITSSAAASVTEDRELGSFMICAGSSCVNLFCQPCYLRLPEKHKLCEECFQHERIPMESVGAQLRNVLIRKLGGFDTTHLDDLFASFDRDDSGELSAEEFSKALSSLNIQPPLTSTQITSLLAQFDRNRDGKISAEEFKDWIFRDHVWQPDTATSTQSSTSSNHGLASSEQPSDKSEVVASAVNFLIDEAYNSHVFSSSSTDWVCTHHCSRRGLRIERISSKDRTGRSEKGHIVFQRAMSLQLSQSMGERMIGIDAIRRVFDQFDIDRNGSIKIDEFVQMLRALGLPTTKQKATLLLHRMEKISRDADDAVDLNEFGSYVRSFCENPRTSKSSLSTSVGPTSSELVQKLIELDALIAAKDPADWKPFCWCLHDRMQRREILQHCHAIRTKLGLSMSASVLQRLCFTLSFQQDFSDFTENGILSSGQVLHKMVFQTPQKLLMSHVKDFDLQKICDSLRRFLKTHTCSNAASLEHWWQRLFDINISQSLDQVIFIDRLVHFGYLAIKSEQAPTEVQELRFVTKLLLALALDAIREENKVFMKCQTEATASNRSAWTEVTFSLFTCLIHRHTINEMELKLHHAIENLLRLGQGSQHFLITFSIVSQPQENGQQKLVMRAIDPILRHEMTFSLHDDEYSKENLWISQAQVQIGNPGEQQWSVPREQAFVAKPNALINAVCWPHLNQVFSTLVRRFQLDLGASTQYTGTDENAQQSISGGDGSLSPLFLVIVETESFVQTLRDQLAQVSLPFFWNVSNQWLDFSVDSAILSKFTPTNAIDFQEVVTSFLAQFAPRSVLAFLKQSVCSLKVRFEVIDDRTKRATITTSDWPKFQQLLSGLQDYYARIEVRPQGQILLTPVHRSGSGSPAWNLHESIELKEPDTSDLRIDQPVVFTDTLQIASIPDESDCQKIAFLSKQTNTLAAGSSKSSSTSAAAAAAAVAKANKNNNHILVVSVRKTLAEGTQPARLYCTAYDPFTSSDYAVEGYPSNWSVDFFNSENEDEIQAKWNAVVENLRVGATLTPKLLVKVYNKQLKTDRLLGECEISIASAIAHEGFVFNEWFALHHPRDLTTRSGLINVAFRFDGKKQTTISLPSAVQEQNMIRRTTTLLQSLPNTLDALTSPSFKAIPEPAPKHVEPEQNKARNTSDKAEVESGKYQQQQQQKQQQQQQQEQELESRIAELEKMLQDSELSRKEMSDNVKQLKAQVADQQQSHSIASVATNTQQGEVTKLKRKLDFVKNEQAQDAQNYQRKLEILEAQLRELQNQSKTREPAKAAVVPIQSASIATTSNLMNLSHASLGVGATAQDILFAIKQILVARCPERPYNGLKKAFVAVADVPGKIAVPSFEDALVDFGLSLSASQKATLLKELVESDSRRRINIEEFFIKLAGESNSESIKSSRSMNVEAASPSKNDKDSKQSTSGRKPEKPSQDKPYSPRSSLDSSSSQASSPSNSVVSSSSHASSTASSAVPAPTRPKVASWSKMKQILSLSVPAGWELRFTKNGNPYYVDHAHKRTQWKHPVEQIETEYREWLKTSGNGDGPGPSGGAQSPPK